MKRPWMPLYVNDILDDPNVVAMSLEEFGAYMKLLCYNWQHRGIPTNTRVLASMLRVNHRTFSRIWPKLSPLFPEINAGLLGNDRVMIELSSADNKSENYSKAAKERESRTKNLGVTDQITTEHNTAHKELSAGADLFGNPVEHPKPKAKTRPEPLPFRPDAAIAAIAESSAGRFVASTLDKGKSIFVTELIRKHPDIETWRQVGRWIANGGDGWKSAIDVRSIGDFPTWVAHSQRAGPGRVYSRYSSPRPHVSESSDEDLS